MRIEIDLNCDDHEKWNTISAFTENLFMSLAQINDQMWLSMSFVQLYEQLYCLAASALLYKLIDLINGRYTLIVSSNWLNQSCIQFLLSYKHCVCEM